MSARDRQAGIAAIWVIIVVILTLVICTASILLWVDVEDKRERQTRMIEIIGELEDEKQEKTDVMNRLPDAIGLTKQEGTLPIQPAQTWRDNAKYRDEDQDARFFPIHPSNVYPELDRKNVDADAIQEAGDDPDTFLRKVAATHFYDTFEDLVHLAFLRVTAHRYLHDIALRQKELVEKRPQIVKDNSQGWAEKNPKLKQRVLKEIAKVQRLISADSAQYNQRKAELEAQIDRVRTAKEEAENIHRNKMTFLRKDKDKQKAIFEELLRTKQPVYYKITWKAVHGVLESPDLQQRHAWINIGSKHRVRTGMRFLIAQRGARNSFKYKGEIEVKRVYLTSAEAEIISVYDNEKPLIHGDMLVNPFFNKDRPLKVAFAGASKPVGHKFSILEATMKILELGSEVHDPDVDTDYLLWTDFETLPGEEDEDEEEFRPGEYPKKWWTAAILGIPIATAKDLYKFLGD